MTTTNINQLPHPELVDTADIPRDIGALAEKLDPGVVPVGAVMMWLGAAAPNIAWLLCQGQTNIAASTYPVLASVLGTIAPANIYVKMPNMVGRVPVGSGVLPGSSPSVDSPVNSRSGQASVRLEGAESGIAPHGHGATGLGTDIRGNHAHFGATGNQSVSGQTVTLPLGLSIDFGPDKTALVHPGVRVDDKVVNVSAGNPHAHFIAADGDHSHGVTGSTAAVAAAQAANYHDNMPPYYTVNYIIRAR